MRDHKLVRSRSMIALLAVAGVMLSGCTADEPPSESTMDTTDSAAETPSAMAQPAAEAPELTDAEVAHAAVTANKIDVAMGELALSKSEDPEVRDFAQTMIRDHSAVIDQAAALAGRLGVTPQANAVSRSLQQGADEARAELEALSGAAFNRAYMEHEVEYHQAVIQAVEDVLIPTTENQELADLLRSVAPVLQSHLEHARTVLAGL